MFHKILIVFVCLSFVSRLRCSDVFHENSKVTFYPDNIEESDFFGYSVLLYSYGLVVGAPKATKREMSMVTGLAFNCTTNLNARNVTCYPIEMSIDQMDKLRSLMPYEFYQPDMWFGATIGALTDGKLLICAPRQLRPHSNKHVLANGVCYVKKKYPDQILRPLWPLSRQAFKTDGTRKEYHEFGTNLNFYAHGEVGISMKVTGGNHVIMGAPGLLQWTGGIVDYGYSPDDNSIYFDLKKIVNPYFTKDFGPDDYLGYSVESGVFENNGTILYVGGAPRSKMGYGQVVIFEPPILEESALKIRAKLRGPQLGAYFGASLCCVDINNDGTADLLVGAPNYVEKNSGLPYDQGAVFVYMSKQKEAGFILDPFGSVKGSGVSGARFGTTIADLGDVDGDGYEDVAVGAPWEDEGKGAVYIYRGFSHGLRSKYNQRISAEGAGSFGIAISKGFDVDGNHCNDLAIGAATSATVYLYRSVPTVFARAYIQVPDAMNLPHNATGFTALFCVTLNPETHWPHVKLPFKGRITVDPENNRAMMSGDSEYKTVGTPGAVTCDEQTVEVKPTADLSKPILIKFELEPDELLKNDSNEFNMHAARASDDSVLEATFLIQLVRDCGEDMICTPWLMMSLEALDNPYIPGTDAKLGARLTILNKEEPAYGARVNISLPMIPKRLPSSCQLSSPDDLIMTCDVPAPLLRNEEITWDLELEYNTNESNAVDLKVTAELEDSLYYRNISKESMVDLIINVTPQASFNITGKPLPNATIAISREKLYSAENITFVNFIEITNLGPSDWYELNVLITFNLANLSTPISGCEDQETSVNCVWSVAANVTLPVVLPLRVDLGRHGELLENDTILNGTTKIFLTWKDVKPGVEFYTSTTITSTLVVEPLPPLWPLILGIVSGLLLGLALLALIVYLLHKYGFFTRNHHERLKEAQDASASSDNELDELVGAPSTAAATQCSSNDSNRELLFEDSD